MAYVKGTSVYKGNTGQLLKTYTGKGAAEKARKHVERLHKKYKPKAENRGAVARRREEAEKKSKKK